MAAVDAGGRGRVVGYWARVHDLTIAQVREFAGDLIPADDDGAGFVEGWDAADMELMHERIEELRDQLDGVDS